MIRWLNQELIKRKLSARKLSTRIGKSPTYVSSVLAKKIEPGLNFYMGLAEEFNIPVENIIQLAIGKASEDIDDGPLTAKEIWRLANVLTPEEREEVLDFVDYVIAKRKKREVSTNERLSGDSRALDIT